jgi:L-ribulose-5-phosphate 3-epimerase
MGSLKIGLALWSVGKAQTFTELEALLDIAASTGVKGVQLWAVDGAETQCVLDPVRCATPPQRQKVRKACVSRGLAISGLCAQLHGPNTMGGFGEDDAGLEARLDKTRKVLRMAAELDAPIVTTHIGPVPADSNTSQYARYLKSLISVLRDAEKVGAYLAMETGQEAPGVMKQLIEDVGSPNLKVNFDPANMLDHGVLESLALLAPHIVHTHAKDKHATTGRPTVGQGRVPWTDYIAALKNQKYEGWFAIEDESGNPNVKDSIVIGRKFLEKF